MILNLMAMLNLMLTMTRSKMILNLMLTTTRCPECSLPLCSLSCPGREETHR